MIEGATVVALHKTVPSHFEFLPSSDDTLRRPLGGRNRSESVRTSLLVIVSSIYRNSKGLPLKKKRESGLKRGKDSRVSIIR